MTADLAAYAAALSRCATPADAAPLLADPPAGVASTDLDEGLRVAVLHVAPGALAAVFDGLGAATEAPAVPSTTRGPLAVRLYPAAPGVVAVYGVPHVAAVTVRWPATGPVGDLRLDPATGRLAVRRGVVGPGTTRLAADALGGAWRDMRNGYAWLDVEHDVPGGAVWSVSLSFAGDALSQVALGYLGPGEQPGWGAFTEQRDKLDQERIEAWFERQLGPPNERGDRVWRKELPWGQAGVGYDDRAGYTAAGLMYAGVSAPAR